MAARSLTLCVVLTAAGCGALVALYRGHAAGGAAAPVAAVDGGHCLAAPAPVTVDEPDRNLIEIETISNAIRQTTMSGFCAAVSDLQLDAVADALAPGARVQRLFPRSETVVAGGPAFDGRLVRPSEPGCFGDGRTFVADLRTLTQGWTRVDRCFFKPYRIFATQGEPRRATVDLHLWLGGAERDGGRVGEKGDVHAEMEETQEGGWRFTRLAFGERERVRSRAPAFTEWTRQAGLPTAWTDEGYVPEDLFYGQILYGGVAIGDYDNDGWPDLYISRTGPDLLLRNDGTGRFTDVTARAGAGDPGNGQAALFADLDNDGDQDLFVVNAWYSLVGGPHSKRGHRLYRNDGNGTFTDVGTSFGPIGPASGVSAADYDRDGLLDLYVTYYQDERLHPYHHFIEARDGFGNRLYRNLGALRFEDATERAGVGGRGWSYASAWADYDADGDDDLYVANDFGDNYLFRNRGDGAFEDVAGPAGVLDPANGMSADWGDYDNDGRLDLYIANMYSKTGNQFLPLYPDLDPVVRRKLLFSVQGNSMYRNRPDGTFEETGRRLGVSLAGWAWGSNFFDYDNDGWLDLHVANGFWAGPTDADA